MEWIIFIVIIFIIYLISKRFTKKEAEKFIEENSEPKEALDLSNIDVQTQVIVKFEFLSRGDQFLLKSLPNITIDGDEKFKLLEYSVSLKLSPSFSYYFAVPYLGKESFKASDTVDLIPGHRYLITFKPKIFVFQKPKVNVIDQGIISV